MTPSRSDAPSSLPTGDISPESGSLPTGDLPSPSAAYSTADFNPLAKPGPSAEGETLSLDGGPLGKSRRSTTPGDDRSSRAGDFELDGESSSGDRLDDYEILGELGAGGMGVVLKARQKKLNRIVALKMVLGGGRATESQLARFRSEALAVAKLDHPHIVQVYDIGDHDGLPFFAMEYVDGGSLEKRAGRRPVDPKDAAGLMETTARAVHYAHARGIVHRDLKPANILLRQRPEKTGTKPDLKLSTLGDGRPAALMKVAPATAAPPPPLADCEPKITDFGLAKFTEEGEETGQTRTGAVMGTPNYMAPEQAEGQNSKVTHLADVYALGATLYELLTGRPPFQGTSAVAVISQVKSEEPINPSRIQPGLPKDLETVCLKALQKEPEKRYATAEEFADDLRRYLDGQAILARPVGSGEKFVRWCRRKPWVAGLSLSTAALALLCLASGIAYVFVLRAKNEEIAAKSEAIRERNEAVEKANTDLTTANGRLEAERDATRQLSDFNAHEVQYLVRDLTRRLTDLGLVKERQLLVERMLAGVGRMQRLTEGGAGIADRTRVSGLVQLGDSFRDLAAADKERASAFRVQAADQYMKAKAVATELSSAKPESDLARGNLALAEARLGKLALDRGELSDAKAAFDRSLAIRKQIAESPKATPGSRDALLPADVLASLADAHENLAAWATEAKQPDDARASRAVALDLRQKALAKAVADPKATEEWIGVDAFRAALAKACMAAAADAAEGKRVADAQKFLKLAQEHQEKAADAADGLPHQKALADLLFKIGVAQLKANKPGDALDSFERMQALAGQLARDADPGTAADRRFALHLANYGVGVSHLKLGNRAKATEAFRGCVRACEELVRLDDRPRHFWALMVALARAGYTDRAVAVLKEEGERERFPDDFHFNAACAYSLAAHAVGGWKPDGDLTPDQRKRRGGLLTAAWEQVGKVVTLKSKRAADLDGDPDLEFLQAQPDFKDRVAKLRGGK